MPRTLIAEIDFQAVVEEGEEVGRCCYRRYVALTRRRSIRTSLNRALSIALRIDRQSMIDRRNRLVNLRMSS